MKKLILLAIIALAFSACLKSGTTPVETKPIVRDTIPDTGRFKLELVKDSTIKWGSVEAIVVFNHRYHLYYVSGEDAIPPGYDPNLNLEAITSDDVAVLIDGVPFSPGMSIPLFVTVANGPYLLKIDELKKIPSDIHIWCRDNYLKDSVDLRKGNYNFSVNNADTNSFGKKRFLITLMY